MGRRADLEAVGDLGEALQRLAVRLAAQGFGGTGEGGDAPTGEVERRIGAAGRQAQAAEVQPAINADSGPLDLGVAAARVDADIGRQVMAEQAESPGAAGPLSRRSAPRTALTAEQACLAS